MAKIFNASGSKIGKIESDGTVLNLSDQVVGRVAGGQVRSSGSVVGTYYDNGDIYQGSNCVGKVHSNGNVEYQGKHVGKVEGGDVRAAAALIFLLI